MTVTNNERREVAKRLREIRPCKSGHIKWWEIARALGLKQPAGWFGWEKFEPDSANRLADLIDPDPDLTCELEPTASERTDAPVRVYECDCCGRSCDSVYAEDYVYCPYCGRLNTAREVEAEE